MRREEVNTILLFFSTSFAEDRNSPYSPRSRRNHCSCNAAALRRFAVSHNISNDLFTIYFFLNDFVLHLSSKTSKENYPLVIFIETDLSFSFGLPKPHGPCPEYLPYPPSILLHASVIIFRTTVSNICHCTYSICNWPRPSLVDVRGYHILAIRDTAYS